MLSIVRLSLLTFWVYRWIGLRTFSAAGPGSFSPSGQLWFLPGGLQKAGLSWPQSSTSTTPLHPPQGCIHILSLISSVRLCSQDHAAIASLVVAVPAASVSAAPPRHCPAPGNPSAVDVDVHDLDREEWPVRPAPTTATHRAAVV